MPTLIVTGGAGFIGSNFVRHVLAQGHVELPAGASGGPLRVVVVDKLTYAGNLENLDAVASDPRFAFERADIADRDAMRKILRREQPAAVLNFAAESHVDRSIDDASEFIRTNVVGTFELLEAARAELATRPADERPAFRFLQVSTDEVYGSLGPTGLFSEETPYAPNSPYAASKAAADHLVRAAFHTYGLPTLITNCSNNYGPYQFPEKLIPLIIGNARQGLPLPVYGDGSNVRDWIFVEDHCAGVAKALAAGRPGEKYNFGGASERSNLEVVHTLCRTLEALLPAATQVALARRGIPRYEDLVTFVADRPGHDRRYAIDDTKARRELGWAPRHDFETGIAATVAWYVENEGWCRRIEEGTYQGQRLGLAVAAGGGAGTAP